MRFQNWNIKKFSEKDREAAKGLYLSGVNPLVSVLLTTRYKNTDEINTFLNTDSAPFYDPFLMADMEKATIRIKKAIEDSEKIAVYGDYDVDGMTSTAVIALWLRSKNANFEIYIPGRFDEGYGLSIDALDTLKSNGTDLVITVDCGITATREAEHAKNIGLDLIITDHHECRETLPAADAVINPKRSDCKYPYKTLAGVGVAFKLVCALENDYQSADVFEKFGRFLALGTIADVMPVTGENRKLICEGLKILNSNPGAGLKQLISEVCKDTERVSTATIGYLLAPRLNAAGRMGDPKLSVELLLTDDTTKANELVAELCHLNMKRRSLEQEIFENALSMISSDKQNEPIILYSRDWNQGVTGVVASRIAERFKLPSIIISIDEDGIGRGSCRSAGGFDIYDALHNCEDILENYGGHTKAAGMDIAEGNIEKLRERIVKNYKNFAKTCFAPGLEIDYEVEKLELLKFANVEALKCLEPYGNENPPPCLCIKNATITALQAIGEGKHSRMKIEKNGETFSCIFFSVAVEDLGVNKGDTVDIAFEPQVNEFRGQSSVQLQLCDIHPGVSQSLPGEVI